MHSGHPEHINLFQTKEIQKLSPSLTQTQCWYRASIVPPPQLLKPCPKIFMSTSL